MYRAIFKYHHLLALAIFMLSISFCVKAQDPQFGHFYTNSILYNPAFTGNTDLGRFALSYRNQWPGIPGNFVSYAGSYEHFAGTINSGFGLQFLNDKAGSGGLTTTGINLSYAYQMVFSRKLAMMAGLKGGFFNKRYDFSRFTFADQIARDDAPESVVNEFRNQVSYANFGTGVVLYHAEKYWFGISVDHLNQPATGFVDETATLPLFTSIQGGWNFYIPSSPSVNQKVTLTALYKAQLKWDQLDIGAYYSIEPAFFGLWYRGLPVKNNPSSLPNYDALTLMAGVQKERITFAYSYDITISRLAANSAGAHEISLIYELPKPKKRRRKFFRIPCPKF